MTWTVDILAAAHGDTEAGSLQTADFTFDAGKLLVVYYGGQQNSGGDFTVSLSAGTTGLTLEPVDDHTVQYSIGWGHVACALALTGAGGTGHMSISFSETVADQSLHVLQVDGADLSGALALDALVQQKPGNTVGTSQETLTVTFDAATQDGNLVLAGAKSIISLLSHQTLVGVTNDYSGTDGCLITGKSEAVLTSYDIIRDGTPIGGCASIGIELLGLSAEPPPGAPAELRQTPRVPVRWSQTPNRFRRPRWL